MEYLVIGLGNLGKAIARNLSSIGHKVLGVDISMDNIESFKSEIEACICLNSADPEALKTLPFDNIEAVFICYSKNFGLSVQTTALLRNLGVKNIIVRSISPIHETVIKSIGVNHIMRPEIEFANKYSIRNMLEKLLIGQVPINEKFHVIRYKAPILLLGKSVETLDFGSKYNLQIIGIERPTIKSNLVGVKQIFYETIPMIRQNVKTRIEKGDILMLFGRLQDIKSLEALN